MVRRERATRKSTRGDSLTFALDDEAVDEVAGTLVEQKDITMSCSAKHEPSMPLSVVLQLTVDSLMMLLLPL